MVRPRRDRQHFHCRERPLFLQPHPTASSFTQRRRHLSVTLRKRPRQLYRAIRKSGILLLLRLERNNPCHARCTALRIHRRVFTNRFQHKHRARLAVLSTGTKRSKRSLDHARSRIARRNRRRRKRLSNFFSGAQHNRRRVARKRRNAKRPAHRPAQIQCHRNNEHAATFGAKYFPITNTNRYSIAQRPP